MTIRVDVLEDLTIEIMRIDNGKPKHLKFKDPESAFIIFRYLLKKDLEKAGRERFVPKIEKEAREAFKTLSERSPYHGKR